MANGLVTANQFQLVPEFSRLGTGFAQGQQIGEQFRLGREREELSAQQGTQFEQQQSQLRSSVLGSFAEQLKSVPIQSRPAVIAANAPELAKFNINASVFEGADLSDSELDNVIAGSRAFTQGKPSASAKAFAPVVDPATGQLGIPTFDPATQKAGFQTIPGAPVQQTPEQKRLAGIKTKEREAEIAVSETEKKEVIKQRVARASKIKEDLSERNRNAARSESTLRQALTLAQGADQGLSGAAQLQLSRLVPGIDVTQEGALDATLKQLALEQLQQFKGPTTDFEFGVTQSIAGALGDSKTANIARIKSLDRARFFNEKEFNQFNQFIKDGGDPDNFRFNFQEVVKTKKGPFTLRDIQDTAVQNNLTIEETIKRLNQ